MYDCRDFAFPDDRTAGREGSAPRWGDRAGARHRAVLPRAAAGAPAAVGRLPVLRHDLPGQGHRRRDAQAPRRRRGRRRVARVLAGRRGRGACDFKMVREALTDKDGEWSITGTGGEEPTEFGYLRAALSFVVHWTERPSIQTYKRGYMRNDHGPGRLEAFPFIRNDRGQEGIILIRPGDTREEERLFAEKYGGLYWPFIPVKDPEKKLREMDFDFRYPQKVQCIEAEGRELRPTYIVYGLSRAKTKDDFKNAPGLILHTKAMGRLKILPGIIERDSQEDFKGYD